nr:precorrin-2 C(20)-methyltransferase [uncultured Sellimonas sp.]
MTGMLYGIGVGPGESALMTIKAVRMIEKCDMIAVPVSDASLKEPVRDDAGKRSYGKYLENCTAYKIALPEAPDMEEKPILYLPMPMMKDKEILKVIHDAGAKKIMDYLDEGKTIGFLTLGDPSVYSTYLYIHKRVVRRGYKAEIIPGIPSFCAAAARLNIGIAENREEIHILPASYEIEEGLKLSGTKILMKTGKKMPYVKETVKQHGDRFFMVENCGMENEKIYEDIEEVPDRSSYYSLIMIKEES